MPSEHSVRLDATSISRLPGALSLNQEKKEENNKKNATAASERRRNNNVSLCTVSNMDSPLLGRHKMLGNDVNIGAGFISVRN